MKKKLIIIFSSIAGAALIIVAIFVACSGISPSGTGEQESGSGSESGTVTLPTHLSPTESNEEGSSEPVETKKEQTSGSEAYTESDNSSSTQANEEESEETSPAPTEPSLKFSSHGDGTCSVLGIGSVTDSYLTIPLRSPDGDVVTSIADRAFFGNSFIRAIEIPSTVSHIGDMAFSSCSELIYISVDKNNKSFMDIGGILFSSDMTCIISYPSSSGASSIAIPSSVSKIAPMAFFACNNLKTIEYDGTAEQWSKIEIGEMNYGLYSTSIICKDAEK